MALQLDQRYLKGYVEPEDVYEILPEIDRAHTMLETRTGPGAEFTGWIDLPQRIPDAYLDELDELGQEVRDHSDCLLSIGIGGSYVGIRASLEFLIAEQKIPVYFAGHNLSSGYLYHLLRQLRDKRITVTVVSKSGTTTEPALAFRIVKDFMKQKYDPKELKRRIICVTDPHKGALREMARQEGFRTFPIDKDVGGRFSVLTSAGLVPLSIAGINFRGMIEGASHAVDAFSKMDMDTNLAYQYAAARYLLYQKGRVIEVLSTFYQRMAFIEEWWKQLFGESEGKDGKGIFPASLQLTQDLHSMGQMLQEGPRNMFETFMVAQDSEHRMPIPREDDDWDGFNCIAGRDLDYVNKQAYRATAEAHYEGGVPNMTILIPRFDAQALGELFYFFQKAVAVTGYLLGVNPFNQPGVEAYKKKMFQLLGRG